jgi:tRNA (guanine37-N1)-methyltransferase
MAAIRFDVVSVFPGLFAPVFEAGVVGRAIARGLVELHAHDLRAHTHDRHRQVDDVPFGGGPGMVIKPEPVFEAVEALRPHNPGPVILMEPWGEPFTQRLAAELAAQPGLIIVCGRYEGVDDRVRERLADREVSIGDYVLSGGELPAMVVIDAVARLVPGVLGDQDSLAGDSFAAGLLGHPQYTRPAEFRGLRVPEVLLSGNHREIEAWRRAQAKERTRARAGSLGSKGNRE